MRGAARVVANGTVYWYTRRGGPQFWRGTLDDERESAAAIVRAYHAAIDTRPVVGTIARLCDEFEASATWAGYSARTKRNWRPVLDGVRDRFGWMSADEFADAGPDLVRWRDEIARRAPRSADMMLQGVSRLASWGRNPSVRLLPKHCTPTEGIERAYRPREQSVPPLDRVRDAISKLDAHLASAVLLALNTGLRRGDLISVDWRAVESEHGRIVWRPSKSRRSRRVVVIPIGPDLAQLLARLPREPGPILRNLHGEPWTGDGLSSSLWKALHAIGHDWSLHDLRRACATHLASQGWTSRQMARVLGWSEAEAETMAATYVDELAKSGAKPAAKSRAKPSRKASKSSDLRV